MAFKVSLDVKKEFDVEASFDKVFDTLADVPKSVSFFPKVEKLDEKGDNTFRWEFEKVGVQKYSIQTIYTCKYISDKDSGTIKWEPVDDEGVTANVEGEWDIEKVDDNTTRINFTTKGTLNIPLPSLIKMVVAPIVQIEFEGMINKYHDNLTEFFEG